MRNAWMCCCTALMLGPPVGSLGAPPLPKVDVGMVALPDGAHGIRLATRLTISSGWHIYWKNPGDSGLATRVEWTLPPGVQAGLTRYPGPTRFSGSGGSVTFGYKREVTLWHDVKSQPGAFGEAMVNVRWLACQESMCVPGRSQARVNWPPPRASGTEARTLEALWTALPSALPSHARVRMVSRNGGAFLTVETPATTRSIRYFPDLPNGVDAVAVEEDTRAIRIHFRGAMSNLAAQQGVLQVVTDAGEQWWEIAVPWPGQQP